MDRPVPARAGGREDALGILLGRGPGPHVKPAIANTRKRKPWTCVLDDDIVKGHKRYLTYINDKVYKCYWEGFRLQ